MTQVALYLMTLKGFIVLQEIIKKGYNSSISYVVSTIDTNVKKDYFLEIKGLCIKNKIPFYAKNELPDIKCAYRLAIGWRWMIKDSSNLIVIHDSLLPKYRGFAPLVSALINGEKQIGATIIFATDEYDEGDIINQQQVTIKYPIKIQDALELMSNIYANLTLQLLHSLKSNNKFDTYKQAHEEATYSLWRDDEDYNIDWNLDSEKIKRFIDAVGFPYKGAKCRINNEEIRIWDAQIIEDVVIENRVPGKILFKKDNQPVIVCGKGLLRIEKATINESEIYKFKNFRCRLE